MVTGPPANHKKPWTGSYRRHGLFFLMAFVVVYLCYSTVITSNWSAERWIRNQTRPLDGIYKSQRQRGTSGVREANAPGSNLTSNTDTAAAPAAAGSGSASASASTNAASASSLASTNATTASALASTNATTASALASTNATTASSNAASASSLASTAFSLASTNAATASAKAASASSLDSTDATSASALASTNATTALSNAASTSLASTNAATASALASTNATTASSNAASASSLASTASSLASTNAATASDAAAGFSADASSPVVPQTDVTSTAPRRDTEKATLKPTPVPYVSPGPYLVEYPYEYRFIINEPQRCEREKPFLVLVVPVAPTNKAHRDVIRATWGSESWVSGKAVRLFFLLGLQGGGDVQRQVVRESGEHRDVIQSDFIDCYKNLTIKTMVMLEWLDSYCRGASYAMKIDSDMFLNVANLVNMLTYAPKTNYMTGLVARNAQVLRDPTSKWYLPYAVHPPSQYPRYALGLGYVLSSDLPKKLVEASRHVKPLYIEDVFLGLCMEYLGIPPTDSPSWNYFHVVPLAYSRCAFSGIIATTTDRFTDRVWIWKDFKTHNC